MNKLDTDAEIQALRAAALEDLRATSDFDLVLEALADEERIDTVAARSRSIMLSAVVATLRRCIGDGVLETDVLAAVLRTIVAEDAMLRQADQERRSPQDRKLEDLSLHSFERMVQSLVLTHFGPNVTAFADGPDGGREATFEGRVFYPDFAAGWAGRGLLQVKYRQASNRNLDHATWLIDLLDRELGRYRCDGNRLYHSDGGFELMEEPRYYMLITNVVFSSVAEKGGKERIVARLEAYRQRLQWKDFGLWDGEEISRLSSDLDAIHGKVGYQLQFHREHQATSAATPPLLGSRDVVPEPLASQGYTDVKPAKSSETISIDAREQQSAPTICAIKSAASDVHGCSYIRDGDLPKELLHKVRACAMAITHDAEAVQDVEQQVKLQLLAVNRERWEQITDKWSYVIRIARNESRTWLRRESRQRLSLRNRAPHELEGDIPLVVFPEEIEQFVTGSDYGGEWSRLDTNIQRHIRSLGCKLEPIVQIVPAGAEPIVLGFECLALGAHGETFRQIIDDCKEVDSGLVSICLAIAAIQTVSRLRTAAACRNASAASKLIFVLNLAAPMLDSPLFKQFLCWYGHILEKNVIFRVNQTTVTKYLSELKEVQADFNLRYAADDLNRWNDQVRSAIMGRVELTKMDQNAFRAAMDIRSDHRQEALKRLRAYKTRGKPLVVEGVQNPDYLMFLERNCDSKEFGDLYGQGHELDPGLNWGVEMLSLKEFGLPGGSALRRRG